LRAAVYDPKLAVPGALLQIVDDAREFLDLANQLQFRPEVTIFSLEDANKALMAVKNEDEFGSIVIVP